MSWAKYDDALPQNRKTAWLRAHGVNGIAALGLHLLLNTWSRHEGMQGFIPEYVPEQLAGRPWRKLIELLADDGCGMLLAVEYGWMINDYDEYGDRDDGTPVDEKKARLSKVRAEAGRKGGNAKAAKAAGKATDLPSSKPPSNGKQSSSPVPIPVPTDLRTSQGSGNVPPGAVPRILRGYVQACRDAGVPAPEDAQDRVSRSARKLIAEGFPPEAVLEAARNAAVGGWTDLATQLQRDAARASPTTNGTTSTTDQRVSAALTLAADLERKALP